MTMIDSDDGDTFWALSMFTKNPWVALLFLAVAVVLWVIASRNETECEQRRCLVPGQTAKLLDHECVCASSPMPIYSLPDDATQTYRLLSSQMPVYYLLDNRSDGGSR